MKKIVLLLTIIFLSACGITQSNSQSSKVESSISSHLNQESIESSSSIKEENSSSFISESNKSESTSSFSQEIDYGTPKSRHDAYVNAVRDESVYFRAKVIAHEQYSTNLNSYNAYLQDGIYGYYLINIPEIIELSIGKSYEILTYSDNSSTQSKANASGSEEFIIAEEIEDIEIASLNLDGSINSNDSIGAKVSFNINSNDINITNDNGNNFFNYNNYKILYRTLWVGSNDINNFFTNLNTNMNISISGILKPHNEVWISNSDFLKVL